ncbi:hypothetical protein BCR34DRAFT_568851 [Clohesyomyces aquaticus]|uniref:Essential protein Yae1 N-terminal domain-containing protein n=1 Tax=Clohesyomyces aquaticus TaxID=1231657 RepID=A0A1Y1ZFV7_9PLEO|nr:hypothetical protein BCR34DRAFT_568851 [Clohesyomyces aquaticus]
MPESTHPFSTDTDPFTFDSVLTLEDDLYTTAYASGAAAGARAGRIEGRIFGLEKGFEKFAALGVLHGRAVVWGARIPPTERRNMQSEPEEVRGDGEDEVEKINAVEGKEKEKDVGTDDSSASQLQQLQTPPPTPSLPILPCLPENPRLQKHISTLHALTEPLTFSTLNTEDAVADFDERVKRAGAKVKIIERMVGEVEGSEKESEDGGGGEGKAARKGVRVSGEGGGWGKGKGDEGMEDFSIRGLRGIRM